MIVESAQFKLKAGFEDFCGKHSSSVSHCRKNGQSSAIYSSLAVFDEQQQWQADARRHSVSSI
jgi:hypothetical protein